MLSQGICDSLRAMKVPSNRWLGAELVLRSALAVLCLLLCSCGSTKKEPEYQGLQSRLFDRTAGVDPSDFSQRSGFEEQMHSGVSGVTSRQFRGQKDAFSKKSFYNHKGEVENPAFYSGKGERQDLFSRRSHSDGKARLVKEDVLWGRPHCERKQC